MSETVHRSRGLGSVGALLLAGLMCMSPVASAQTLLSDDFNDGNATGWQTYVSGWSVAGGAYQGGNTGANIRTESSWSGGYAWADYTAQTRISLNGTYTPADGQLLFRYQNDLAYASCQVIQYAGMQLNIYDQAGGQRASTNISIAHGAWYTLRGTIQGSTLSCQILELPGSLISATVSTPPTGTVALRNTHIPVAFDDVVVTALAGSGSLPTLRSQIVDVFPSQGQYNMTGIGDLDGDGRNELVVTHGYSGLTRILKFCVDGTYSVWRELQLPAVAAPRAYLPLQIVDVDADGDRDIVAYNRTNNQKGTLVVVSNEGGGTFTMASYPTPETDAGFSIAVADVDGDALPDVITTDLGYAAAGRVHILLNAPNGTRFTTSQSFVVAGGWAEGAAAYDFDDDGDRDLAVSTHAFGTPGTMLFWNQGGSFPTSTTLLNGDGSRSLEPIGADVDGDGDTDVVTVTGIPHSYQNKVKVFRRGPGGTYGSAEDLVSGQQPATPRAADFNGDGRLDIVVDNTLDRTLSFFLGDPAFGGLDPVQRVYSSPELSAASHGFGGRPLPLNSGDLDGDGDADIVFSIEKTIVVWNGPAGVLAMTPSSLPAATGFAPYVAAVHAPPAAACAYSVTAGGLPSGPRLDGSPGLIPSQPMAWGSFAFTIQASDTAGCGVSASYELEVAPPLPITLSSGADSFLRQGAPNTNEGANPVLRIQGSGHNRVVVGFDLSGIPLQGLTRARLRLTIAHNPNNWGPTGRLVYANRLTAPWTEGNGWTVGGNDRGTGAGVTWECATDSEIGNQNDDCAAPWDGGAYAVATAPPVNHTNGLTGTVEWDVTTDVLTGAPFGWLLRKDPQGASGEVGYHSREAGVTPPTLVLEYD